MHRETVTTHGLPTSTVHLVLQLQLLGWYIPVKMRKDESIISKWYNAI